MTIRIAIVGFGKIARDEHLPAIVADARFELVGVSTRSADPGLGVPYEDDPARLFERLHGGLDAVAICTPPDVRHAIARHAIEAGLAVLLEKPPAATMGAAAELVRLARDRGVPLFTAWHSQHAPAVAPAAALLRGETVTSVAMRWFEDVRKYHPGQEWIWAPGGFGVFDPGVNALSIATRILPDPLFVTAATLTYPANRQAPIAAAITFDRGVTAEFDWRPRADEQWSIAIDTQAGRRIELHDGGHRLVLDGVDQSLAGGGEYPALYARFAELVAGGGGDVDLEPLRIVADAFLLGERQIAEPFS